MSTLLQIESAVADLPRPEQWSLLAWLRGQLEEPTKPLRPSRTQAELIQWMSELAVLREQTHTGTAGTPLQEIMNDLREDRF